MHAQLKSIAMYNKGKIHDRLVPGKYEFPACIDTVFFLRAVLIKIIQISKA